ncbi:hypothetical protein MBLNU459_g1501t1 [Dothideomycetes sp. NU459]
MDEFLLEVPDGLRTQILANGMIVFPEYAFQQVMVRRIDQPGNPYHYLWEACLVDIPPTSGKQVVCLCGSTPRDSIHMAFSDVLRALAGAVDVNYRKIPT